jgi:hypothetical protein
MFHLGKQVALGYAVASPLIGHDHARHILEALQQPPEEAFGGFAIPPLLHKDVEHHTILINRAPEIMQHALDANENLIHVPLIPRPWPAVTKTIGETLAEFLTPTPYRLIGDDDASFGQQQFNCRATIKVRIPDNQDEKVVSVLVPLGGLSPPGGAST